MNEMQSLIGRLEDYLKSCEDKCIDLQILKFEVHEGEMRLYNDFHSYYFKNDPKNPRDPKIIHAAQQFCKMMSVPYSFFSKNPEYMRKGMVDCWLPTLKPEKSVILAKLRKSRDSETDYVIRALLPAEFTNVTNAEVLKCVADVIGDDFKIEFVIGDERDDLVLHVRFLSNEEFTVCGETCCAGFSVIASELGASPLTVETLLHRVGSKSSFLATYGMEPFFSFPYESIQRDDIISLFPSLIVHLQTQLSELKDRIQKAKEITTEDDDLDDLIKSLRLRKGLSDKFHTLLFQEIKKEGVKTRWDFANRMAILAKDFNVEKRIKIERAAGDIIGLGFEKA